VNFEIRIMLSGACLHHQCRALESPSRFKDWHAANLRARGRRVAFCAGRRERFHDDDGARVERQRGIVTPRFQLSSQLLDDLPFPGVSRLVHPVDDRQLEIAHGRSGGQREKRARSPHGDDVHAGKVPDRGRVDDDQGALAGKRNQLDIRRPVDGATGRLLSARGGAGLDHGDRPRVEPEPQIFTPGPQLQTKLLERLPFPDGDGGGGLPEPVDHGQLEIAHPASRTQREKRAVALERDDVDARQTSNDRGVDRDEEVPVRDGHQLEVQRRLECPGGRPLEELHDGSRDVVVDLVQTPDDIAGKSHLHELCGTPEFLGPPPPTVRFGQMTLHEAACAETEFRCPSPFRTGRQGPGPHD
jgi:hypothetical protein